MHFIFSYSEEVFSQHSRRHSNDTNSDFSDDDLLLPDDVKPAISRHSKAGEILSSPTHRKLTPTHIRSNGSSPTKRLTRLNLMETLTHAEGPAAHELHEYYSNIIASLKRSHEDKEKELTYKLQKLEGLGTDDEYLVSLKKKTTNIIALLCENVNNKKMPMNVILQCSMPWHVSQDVTFAFAYCI